MCMWRIWSAENEKRICCEVPRVCDLTFVDKKKNVFPENLFKLKLLSPFCETAGRRQAASSSRLIMQTDWEAALRTRRCSPPPSNIQHPAFLGFSLMLNLHA